MADLSFDPDDVTYTGGTRTSYICGAAVTAGQSVRLVGTQLFLTDATSVTNAKVRGVALADGAIGQPVDVANNGGELSFGTNVVQSGVIYCVSQNSGGICPYEDLPGGDFVSIIGVGSSDSIRLITNVSSHSIASSSTDVGQMTANTVTLRRPLGFTVSSGSLNVTTGVLNSTNAFASYTWASGDHIFLYNSTTGVIYGSLTVASKTDADNIVLSGTMPVSNVTVSSVDGVTPLFQVTGTVCLKQLFAQLTAAATTSFTMKLVGLTNTRNDSTTFTNLALGNVAAFSSALASGQRYWCNQISLVSGAAFVPFVDQILDSSNVGKEQLLPELMMLDGDFWLCVTCSATPAALTMTWRTWWESMGNPNTNYLTTG